MRPIVDISIQEFVEGAVDLTNGDGGVLKKVIVEGEGIPVPQGSFVSVLYEGKLNDGLVFDSSLITPLDFQLGKSRVIRAWDMGVSGMRKGEVALLTCAPAYAYGTNGFLPKIPPNATLYFVVKLTNWKGEDLSGDEGIMRTIINPGKGNEFPEFSAVVEVELKGMHEGNVFDERTITFPLGEGRIHNICAGIELALPRFSLGETSLLDIQPKYAFGYEVVFNLPPNVAISYQVHLKNMEKSPKAWNLNAEEKLSQAEFFKKKAITFMETNNLHVAIKYLEKMHDYLKFDVGFDEIGDKCRLEAVKRMHLNLSLCYLKQKNYTKVIKECDSVLEMEPRNEKALFRKAKALMETKQVKAAKTTLQEVLSVNANNNAAKMNLQWCNEAIKEEIMREKSTCTRMFKNFGTVQDWRDDEMLQSNVMTTAFGEWADEERERKPTKFEQENPNIYVLDKSGEFDNM